MNNKENNLQAVLDKQLGKSSIHNLVAAVQLKDRSIDFVGAAGTADPLTGAPMTPTTPYFIASVTKMYTAAVVLRLYEEQCIDLEAPISEYLSPALTRAIHVYKGVDYSERIKVVELLNQSSGLADYETEKPRGGRSVVDQLKAGQDRAVDLSEALEIVRSLSPHFVPGAKGKAYYSNANYNLLGAIIESVTGRTLAVNFEERICAPLGLRQTYLYDFNAPRPGQVLAAIFLKDAPVHIPQYISSNGSAGGMVSTAPECMIFLRAFFEGELFDPSLFAQMTRWNPIFFPLRYGYGLMSFRLPRFLSLRPMPEFVGHSGSTGSFAFICPSQSIYLAGTVNQIASPSKPFLLMNDLVRAAI